MAESQGNGHLTKLQLFAGGTGALVYDLYKILMFSYGMVFYIKVAALSSRQTGLVMIVGQVTIFVGHILFGFLCDNVDVPYMSRLLGRKKTWHCFGVFFLVLFAILAFTRCLWCPEPPLPDSWLGFGYFTVAYGVACFWMAAIELSYLAIVPEISTSDEEIVIHNTIRWVTRPIYLSEGFKKTFRCSWILVCGRKSSIKPPSFHPKHKRREPILYNKVHSIIRSENCNFVYP